MIESQLKTWLLITMLQYSNTGIDLKKAILFFSKSSKVEINDHDKIIESFIIKLYYNFEINVYKKGVLYYIQTDLIKMPDIPFDSKLINVSCGVSIDYKQKLKFFLEKLKKNVPKETLEPPVWDSELVWPSVKV